LPLDKKDVKHSFKKRFGKKEKKRFGMGSVVAVILGTSVCYTAYQEDANQIITNHS
jgi:hypothetical protein